MQEQKGILLVGEPMGLYMSQQEGGLDRARTFALAVAGAELNVAIGVSRLGHRVGYLTKLGDDFHGRLIVRLMNQCGISTEFTTRTSKRPTGIMFKSLTPNGDPEIYYLRRGSAASTLSPADVAGLDMSAYGILHLTGIMPALSESTRAATRLLVRRAREAGLTISFDPNLRPQLWPDRQTMAAFMNEMASQVDLFLPGIAETRELLGDEELAPEEAARRYRELGTRTVIVKCGSRGAYFDTDGARGWGGTFPVEHTVDTVGAGDGFAAGVLTALLEGLDIRAAVTRGNAIGSLQVQARGDNEGMPDREGLAAYLSRNH